MSENSIPNNDPTKEDPYFYRAEHAPIDGKIIQPKKSTKEAVTDDGSLDIMWLPNGHHEYRAETSKDTSFSETIGGAILGAITGETGFNKGPFYIYKTAEKDPEIDLRHEIIDDFAVIDEVRFERPVKVDFVGKFEVSDELLKSIKLGYKHEITKEEIEHFKEEMRRNGCDEEFIEKGGPEEGDWCDVINEDKLIKHRNNISKRMIQGI